MFLTQVSHITSNSTKTISFKALPRMVYWLLPLHLSGNEQALECKHILYVDRKGETVERVGSLPGVPSSSPSPLPHSKHSKPAVSFPTSSSTLPSSLPATDSVAVLQLTIPSKLLHLFMKRCFFRVL